MNCYTESVKISTEQENPDSYDLTPQQVRAIELIVAGAREAEVARMLSIARKTLWNWRNTDAEYMLALDDARQQLFSAVADRYRNLLLRATHVMSKFLQDEAPINDRFRTAYGLLMMAGSFKPAKPIVPELPKDYYFPEPQLPPKLG